MPNTAKSVVLDQLNKMRSRRAETPLNFEAAIPLFLEYERFLGLKLQGLPVRLRPPTPPSPPWTTLLPTPSVL